MSAGSCVGTTCPREAEAVFSQPHWLGSPPPASRPSHIRSTSACPSQSTTNDTASVNLKIGPPFSAVIFSPSSSNAMVITEPRRLGPPRRSDADAGDFELSWMGRRSRR